MKKKLIRPLTIAFSVVLLLGLIFYPKLKPLFGAGDDPGPVAGSGGRGGGQRQILNVSGLLISPVHLTETIRSSGTLRPDEEVDLSFETSGKIVAIYFTEGTRVKEEDLLAKINDKPLQAQLLKLQAQKKLAEEKEFRQRNLLSRDAISQESYDQVVTELQALEADIQLIRARIAETELRAPFDGIIGLRYLSEGAYASPSTKIARLVKLSPLKIEFSIPERYAGVVGPGFPIEFTVDTDTFRAQVYAVDPKVDINTRTIAVRALYHNRNEELKPGRFTAITLQISRSENAVAIPTEALIPEMEGEKVFVYRQGKAESVMVNTGLRTESRIQITGGLNFGDTLLTTGVLQLRQGLPVVLDTLIVDN
ncbi:MAG TPA: efflux RND transporter periplasmic adaptor subunit [Bacteroidetes bacterium]|nr:efflux RND transporter periplasmic adaptor subunit [Bacteroidota bacterium]